MALIMIWATAVTTTAFGVDASLPRKDAVLAFLERQANP
jgi:hypothetical protein